MNCNICCENINKSTRREVKCPYCDFITCLLCFRRYLMESSKPPDCMACHHEFSLDFVSTVTPKTFYNGEYRKKRAVDLLSQERSLLPATQHLVEDRMAKMQRENEIAELMDEEQYLRFRLHEIRDRVRELRHAPIEGEPGVVEKKERNKFIMGCPNGECRGFLSQAWKCGTCGVYACSKCREVKNGRDDETHECDKDTLATVELLKSDTKPCPKCATPIFYISGCDQMWCQHEDTIVWLWNGTKKKARDVVTGDLLIGEDGTPRKVGEMTHGHADMYEVQQRFGENYKVIGRHLLTLENEKNIIDISVEDYMNLKRKRGYHRVASNIIQWEKQYVPLDPYILGMWLGDGTTRGDGFASNDPILIQEWVNWCIRNDCEVVHVSMFGYTIRNSGQGDRVAVGYNNNATCVGCAAEGKPALTCASKKELEKMIQYEPHNNALHNILEWRVSLPSCDVIERRGKARSTNIFKSLLQECGVLNNKHIPLSYISNDQQTRFQLLAGLIDTDGNVNKKAFRFSQSIDRSKLCYSMIDIAHSLGFATTVKIHSPGTVTFPRGKSYTCKDQIKVRIMGNTSIIPTRLKKITQQSCYPSSTINVIPAGCGRFVGWEVSGSSSRYLLGDGTVTHNCTQCRTPFSWKTGQIVTGVIHNPHFYMWQREKNGGVAPRVPGDEPCGRGGCGELPWPETLEHIMRQRKQTFKNMDNCHRLVGHMRGVVIPRYPARIGMEDNTDLRVKFLTNEIDEKKWVTTLKMRQKKAEKNRAVNQVLEMFVISLTDLFTTFVTGDTNALADDADALRSYANRELIKIGRSYNNKVPFVNKQWSCP
jgi:hypothetical protein